MSQSSTPLIAPWCLWKLIWSNIFNLCIQIAFKPNCDSLKGILVRIKSSQKGTGGHSHTWDMSHFLFSIIHHLWQEYALNTVEGISANPSKHKRKEALLIPKLHIYFWNFSPENFCYLRVTRKCPLPNGNLKDTVTCCCGPAPPMENCASFLRRKSWSSKMTKG